VLRGGGRIDGHVRAQHVGGGEHLAAHVIDAGIEAAVAPMSIAN